jgi:hypothetical protein
LSEQLLISALLGGGFLIVALAALGVTDELSFIGLTVSGTMGRLVAGGVCLFLLVDVVLVVGRFLLRVPALELDDQGITARFGMRVQRARWADVASVEPVVVKGAGILRPRFLDVGLRQGGRLRVPIILSGISPETVRERICLRASGTA